MSSNHFHPLTSTDDNDSPPISILAKGKQRDLSTDNDAPILETAYPPASEDAEETRRTLRKWEIAERQRRKAARASSSSSNTPSLVSDVSRRASLLWKGRGQSKHRSTSGSLHTALPLQDSADVVPLQESPSIPSPTHTQHLDGTQEARAAMDDPFANPVETLSPFADSFQVDPNTQNALLSETSTHHPPLPRPLNLPQPKTPPPIEPVSTPSRNPHRDQVEDDEPRNVRWWHDWLCGCGEGPDRGGDFQAGRTNPFE
ncbi:hypothetical protein CPC08DRAFT_758792 [Agrocybe pediades]|nr:hypothetical protein CPC08DRAFT_758792 [Agrocybe pediades]